MEKICIICSKVFNIKGNQPNSTKTCSLECRKQNTKNKKKKSSKSYRKLKRITGTNYYKKHLEYNRKYLKEYNKLESTRLKKKKIKKKWADYSPFQKAEQIKRVNIYVSKRRKIDKLFHLKLILRKHVFRILNKEKKVKNNIKTFDLLGCKPEYLKKYLEKQFKLGMNWDNYGRSGWHIDHIKPLSLAKDVDELVKGKFFHYTNLQPLWAKDNIKKSNKYDEKT
jgi:hypothetical protein